MAVVDTHQHLWTDLLWEALSERNEAPFVRPQGDRWALHLLAEPTCAMPGPDVTAARTALLDVDGVDLALIAPSTALGLEWLPRETAEPLFEAHRAGVRAAGSRFRRWGSISLVDPDPAELDAELADGAVGLCLPAGALATPRALDHLGPVLEHLERSGAPLFIHPGPAPAQLLADSARWSAEPFWWPGLTDYVDAMQRSWLTWVSRGRREHPRLRVLFAMLAGLAPLQAERLAARGASSLAARAVNDPFTWYETSSYGELAQSAIASAVGSARLVHGSDRPVVEGALPAALVTAQATDHAKALLGTPVQPLRKAA